MKITPTIGQPIRFPSEPDASALVQGRSDHEIEAIAEHCIAARALIRKHGSPSMQRMIDLVLFEVGTLLAGRVADEDATGDAEDFG